MKITVDNSEQEYANTTDRIRALTDLLKQLDTAPIAISATTNELRVKIYVEIVCMIQPLQLSTDTGAQIVTGGTAVDGGSFNPDPAPASAT